MACIPAATNPAKTKELLGVRFLKMDDGCSNRKIAPWEKALIS
jgi:hypothetical protein